MSEMSANQKMSQKDLMVVLVTSFGSFMAGLDGTIVNIALPAIAQSLDISTVDASWVLNAYLIIMVSLLMMASRLGDMKGYRRVFLSGFLLFTFGSALCGLAPGLDSLVLARMLQAVGGAMISALGAVMITSYLPPRVRGQALGVVAMFLMLGAALGPVIGGFLTSEFSWRFIFYVNLPVGVIAIMVGLRTLPRLPPVSPDAKLDIPGVVLIFAALGTLILGLTSLQSIGMTTGAALLGASAVFWSLFYLHERQAPEPLVRFSLFSNPAYTIQNAGIMLTQMPLAGVMVLMPFYLELAKGIPTDNAGAILLALPVGMILTAPVSGKLSDHIGTKRPIIAGFAVSAAALYFLSTISPDTGIGYICTCLFLFGAGTGIAFAPLNSAVMGESPVAERGMTSGLVRMMTNLGISLGVALVMLVATIAAGPKIAYVSAHNMPAADLASVFSTAFLFCMALEMLGVLLMLGVKEREPSGSTGGEVAIGF